MRSHFTPGNALALLMVLALAASLSSCGKESAASTSSYHYLSVDGASSSNGGVELTVAGIHVDFDETVSFSYVMNSTSEAGSQRSMTVDDLALEMRADGMTIGEREFEGLKEGDQVLLSKDGIQVNGERP